MASLFSKIINREIPAEIIYEDEQTLAFLDIRPINPGHMLVIPKVEVDQFQDLDEEAYQAVMATVRRMAQLLKDKMQPQRVGLVVYGFDVPHVHVHVIPMDEPGKIKLVHGDEAEPEELSKARQQLVEE